LGIAREPTGGRVFRLWHLVGPVAPKLTTVEKVIARLASRAYGVVSRIELLAAGVTADEIRHRLATGALIRAHRGVYRVGHTAPSVEATYLAAVKACGEGAVLSGMAAAHLFGIVRGPAPRPEVTAAVRRRIPGVVVRRARRIERTRWRGIPVTPLPRVLVDLAARLSLDDLALACHEAGVKHRITPAHVKRILDSQPTAPGSRNLRAVLFGEVRVLLSKLEKRFVALLEEAGLPLPVTNRPAGTKRVDCRWPDHHLTVELDSYTYHASRHAFENDRRREREAYSRGDQFRRYTYGDVFERPEVVLAELQPLLTCEPGTMSSRPSGQRTQALWPPS
jgi:hypothetical protein